jgi:hypothetical protein
MTARDVLGYYVFVSGTIPLALPGPLPNGGGRTWAPISTTLVHGAHDAVLIDPPLTAAQAETRSWVTERCHQAASARTGAAACWVWRSR